MNVLSLLTPKSQVAHLSTTYTLRQVVEKMEAHGYSSLPVLKENGEYFGNISTGDVLQTIRKYQIDWENYSNVSILEITHSRIYEPVKADARVENLLNKILVQNYVPVVDDQNIFIGIVTRKAVIDYLLKKQNP